MAKRPHLERTRPPCVRYEDLTPGAAFNPYQLFTRPSVANGIFQHRTLLPGAKLLWLWLAEAVVHDGYIDRSVRELADIIRLKPTQTHDLLSSLRDAGLLKMEGGLGVTHRLQLTWNFEVFFRAIPRPGTVRPTEQLQESTVRPTEQLQRSTVRPTEHTVRPAEQSYKEEVFKSIEGSVSSLQTRGYRPPETPSNESRGGNGQDRRPYGPSWKKAGRLVFLKMDAKTFWKSLEEPVKRNRIAQVDRVADFLIAAEEKLLDTDPEIAKQARQDYNDYLRELSESGFAIEPKRSKTPIQ